jgi:hypothetical protein
MMIRVTLCCCFVVLGSAILELVRAAPSTFDPQSNLPSVVEDTTKAADCTVTYLVSDIATNDTLAVRMQIAHDPNDRPVNNLMPCPPCRQSQGLRLHRYGPRLRQTAEYQQHRGKQFALRVR